MSDDVLLVHGGTPLEGELKVRGAKNLVPKAMVAALLGSAPSRLRNVPDIRDVRVVRGLLQLHGVTVRSGDEPGELVLDPSHVESANVADIDAHAGSSRIPILFCGPLLHRLGHAFIPGLGGCDIGGRPVDFHFDVLRKFGATIEKRAGGQYLEAPQRLRGCRIRLVRRNRSAISPSRAEDYPEWYQQVVKAADLAENSDVRGCMVIKPWGYAIWENIQRRLDAPLAGVQLLGNAYDHGSVLSAPRIREQLHLPTHIHQEVRSHRKGRAKLPPVLQGVARAAPGDCQPRTNEKTEPKRGRFFR
jgi:hypothetical protein